MFNQHHIFENPVFPPLFQIILSDSCRFVIFGMCTAILACNSFSKKNEKCARLMHTSCWSSCLESLSLAIEGFGVCETCTETVSTEMKRLLHIHAVQFPTFCTRCSTRQVLPHRTNYTTSLKSSLNFIEAAGLLCLSRVIAPLILMIRRRKNFFWQKHHHFELI